MSKAKIVDPNPGGDVRLRIIGDSESCELIFVKGGPKRAYLWIGSANGEFIGTIGGLGSGDKVLQELANAINAELAGSRHRSSVLSHSRPRATSTLLPTGSE